MIGKSRILFFLTIGFIVLVNAPSRTYCQSIPSNVTTLNMIMNMANNLSHKNNSLLETRWENGQGKCGLWLQFAIRRHWNEFTESQRRQLLAVIQSPQTETSKVIGHF